MPADVLPMTFMALWVRHKRNCRPVGAIVADARSGRLPGVEPLGYGFAVVDETKALKAMSRGNPDGR